MKKKISSFLPILLVASLSPFLGSCNTNKPTKTHLDYGLITKEEIKDVSELGELNYSGLTSLIKNEKSFVLVLYNQGCGCWTDFAPVMVEYINAYHIDMEYININEFIGKDKYNLYTETSDMPAVCLFSKGKLKVEATYIDNRDMFKNYKELHKFISENAVLPKQYYIDQATLDSYIKEDKEFNLYIARRECGDCQTVDRDVLSKWNYEVDTVNNPLYIFDLQDYQTGDKQGWYCEHCDLIWSLEEIDENHKCPECEEEMTTTLYQHLKDIYGLSEKNNPVLGFGTGAVPTFQRRKGSQILDMVVVLNDSQNEGVISSYFTSERVQNMPFLQGSDLEVDLNGMTFSKVDEELDWRQNWRSYKGEYNEKYHYPILEKFISTYIN